MKGKRGSTLAAQFDLTSSEIKDRACKGGWQGTFFFFFPNWETKLFVTMLLKNTTQLVQALQSPKAKPAHCSSVSKTNTKNTKSILGLQQVFFFALGFEYLIVKKNKDTVNYATLHFNNNTAKSLYEDY